MFHKKIFNKAIKGFFVFNKQTGILKMKIKSK